MNTPPPPPDLLDIDETWVVPAHNEDIDVTLGTALALDDGSTVPVVAFQLSVRNLHTQVESKLKLMLDVEDAQSLGRALLDLGTAGMEMLTAEGPVVDGD